MCCILSPSAAAFQPADTADSTRRGGLAVYADVPNEVVGFVCSFKTFESDVLIINAEISESKI